MKNINISVTEKELRIIKIALKKMNVKELYRELDHFERKISKKPDEDNVEYTVNLNIDYLKCIYR